jgi:hypothetical protein
MIPLTKTLTFKGPLYEERGSIIMHVADNVQHNMTFTLTDPEQAYVTWEADGEVVAEIGLWFNNKSLVDYDGVSLLPKQLITWLEEMGYTMEELYD